MPSLPPLLLAATTEVLAHHAPFDAMPAEELQALAARLRLRYFALGEAIAGPADGPVRTLYIIQRGTVHGRAPGRPAFVTDAVVLGEGESFPLGALIGARATTLAYTAASDVFCYTLDEGGFHETMEASAEFRRFATQRLAHLLVKSASETRDVFAGRAAAELGMASPIAAALRRPPVMLPPQASVRTALETMKSSRVGSVVVASGDGAPLGIFTATDVLDRVALAGIPLDRPVSEVMTRHPVSIPGDHPVADAAQLMARHGFRHLLVMDGTRLAGVISERDLFALQRRSVQSLRKEVARAATPEWLAFAARDVQGLAGGLLAQGVGAESLLQLVTALNDALVERAVALACESRGIDPASFCWIGLGSEGRMEQTLATDQDNAIVFPDAAPTGERERLLALAVEVNDTLAACGFPLCKGGIMACNPRWCLPLAEWCGQFDHWMRNPAPEALMNAAIFFDFRALAGDARLSAALRDFLRPRLREREGFLRQMAANALEVRPPLGFFDEISIAGEGRIDLKLQASRPFVDCARILALAAGVDATSTAQRLREAGPRLRMGEDEIAATVQAFHFVQMLRLRNQDEDPAPQDPAQRNRLLLARLNSLDRRILKEALRQARKLQNRVALDYQLA